MIIIIIVSHVWARSSLYRERKIANCQFKGLGRLLRRRQHCVCRGRLPLLCRSPVPLLDRRVDTFFASQLETASIRVYKARQGLCHVAASKRGTPGKEARLPVHGILAAFGEYHPSLSNSSMPNRTRPGTYWEQRTRALNRRYPTTVRHSSW